MVLAASAPTLPHKSGLTPITMLPCQDWRTSAGSDIQTILCLVINSSVWFNTTFTSLPPPSRSDSYRKAALAGLEHKPELRGIDLSKFEGSPAEALEDAFEYLNRRYGSALRYLAACGFGYEEQVRTSVGASVKGKVWGVKRQAWGDYEVCEGGTGNRSVWGEGEGPCVPRWRAGLGMRSR